MGLQDLKPIKYMPNTGMHRYLINKDTLKNLKLYQQQLAEGLAKPGKRLQAELNYFLAELKNQQQYDPQKELTFEDKKILLKLPPEAFIQLLMNTRKPTVFAEGETIGPMQNWNQFEYQIMGNICSSIEDVKVYDNGRWGRPKGVGDGRYKDKPHSINLLCVPGAILRKGFPDYDTLVSNNTIDEKNYKNFYKAKLSAVFQQANDSAKRDNQQAFITVPGIGDGAFAGQFSGKTVQHLHNAIAELIQENPQWENIGCVWIDGFRSKVCKDTTIGTTLLRVRNTGTEAHNDTHTLFSNKKYGDLGQMSKAEEYAETLQEQQQFQQCKRFKIFAWDHFSYEGNDWVNGSRRTDEANMASCNALSIISGGQGEYRPHEKEYAFYPKGEYGTWGNYFRYHNIKQAISDRLYVLENGALNQRPDPKQALQKLKNSLVDPKPSKTVSLFKKKIAKNSSNLSQEQIEAINKQIDTLEKEIKSSWPYPNKERKQIKKHALEKLIEYAQKDPVATAVAKIIEEFPDAIKGTLSKRTATLLASLQTETPKKQI